MFLLTMSCLLAVALARPEHSPALVEIDGTRSSGDYLDMTVRAFGETHSLNLKRATVPGFTIHEMVTSEDGSIKITESPESMQESQLYYDVNAGAFLQKVGDSYEGVISHSVSIKPTASGHEAFQPPPPDDLKNTCIAVDVPGQKQLEDSLVNKLSSTRATISVQPEVYVLVDSALAKAIGTDEQIKTYLSVFFNAVNHRFRTIEDPKVDLILAGVLINRDKNNEPFIKVVKGEYIDYGTLEVASEWIRNQSALPPYDLAFLMTGRDIVENEGGKLKHGIAGVAWNGGVCVTTITKSFKFAMGEDIGGHYLGVITAAHEIAHNLGAPHDGEPTTSDCPWDDGYIMSYVVASRNALFFSKCSAREIKKHLQKSQSDCVRSVKCTGCISLSINLPGDFYSMDKQCQILTGKSEAYRNSRKSDNELCYNLSCEYKYKQGKHLTTNWETFNRPAAEGTPCKNGGYCIDGKCQ